MNSTTTASTSFSQIPPMVDTSPASDLVSLRNFVVDEDRANLGSDLWKSLDKSAFILAQRDAIETYNLARAMRLSEESAANDERRRLAQAEEAARSLARSWNVDGLQTALLKNTSPPSSSSPPRPRHLPPSSPPSRPPLKRNPSTTDNPSNTPSKVSSTSAANAESSSQQKRRKASISSSSQPQYSYSTSNYSSYPYQSHNQSNTPGPTPMGTSQASVHAQQQFEGRKHSTSASSSSSASSRDIQAGQILNPKESSPRTQSPLSSASAQAAAAEREKEREKGKGKERSRSNSNSNSSSTSRKRSSSSAAQQVNGPQPHPQVQVPPQNQSPPQPQSQTQQQQQRGPRDIFSPVRFNCAKCGNSISSVVHSEPSLALTSPDPFAHPFASALHVICANPSCGAVHCRGCLQTVKCRDVDHPSSDSQALVLVSSSTSTSPPSSNPTSPTRLAFSSSKSPQQTQSQAHSQRACAGGPGCALWSCCSAVRVIAVWEALRAFDALVSAEAGSNQQQGRAGQPQVQTQSQGETVGRQCREAYIRTVISSKADKSMRKFEDGFVRLLKVVASWLQFPAELSSSAQRQSMILEPDDESQSPDTLVLLHLARLFSSSHLLEVVHTFLSNRNVKDWMTHAETYLDVLDVVGKMMDCGLGFLLKEVSGVQVTSTPALASASGSGYYNPFAAVPTSLPSSVSTSPSQSPPPLATLTLPSASPSSPPPTLYDLVSQLETYRGELKKFLTKVSFGVTVDKASKLHEAITYLVLQLVVGEF